MGARDLCPEQSAMRRQFRLNVIMACGCPKCLRPSGFRCLQKSGRIRRSPHQERVNKAREDGKVAPVGHYTIIPTYGRL